jgi:putative FmdB family regulatory protein
MPIYEYCCQSCGHELEAIQKMAEDPLTDCPECGKPSLQKLISAAGFRLKGAGWYETDFKSGKQKNLAKSETGADGGQKKSEQKPEKKAAGCGSGACGCH